LKIKNVRSLTLGKLSTKKRNYRFKERFWSQQRHT